MLILGKNSKLIKQKCFFNITENKNQLRVEKYAVVGCHNNSNKGISGTRNF